MIDRIPKVAVIAAALLMFLFLAYMAYSRPGLFSDMGLVRALILLEFLLASLWFYRQAFLPIVLLSFLLAGSGLPFAGGMWTSGRWYVLCAGAVAGFFIMLKEHGLHFRSFHAFAVFAAAAGVISAAVSRYPGFALLKAASLVLLFLYAGTGARLAARGREQRFIFGLLVGTELFVGIVALFYIAGSEVMGNPNSLGAVMGVIGAPVLLWGTLVSSSPSAQYRRLTMYSVTMYLLFHSHSRAGMAAACVSCAVQCFALRRYKLFGQGLVIFVILLTSAAILNPEHFSKTASSLTSSIIYKNKEAGLGVFESRRSPWQAASENIRKHLWLGSGFGTTDNGSDASARLDSFRTVEGSTAENGSSYLTIVTWVGMLGILPFALLLMSLAAKGIRTCIWMRNTGDAWHPAIPLALIVLAGLTHAAFEDWLFAPGYYLCVFLWSMAFILVDLAPFSPVPSFVRPWQTWHLRQPIQGVVPTR